MAAPFAVPHVTSPVGSTKRLPAQARQIVSAKTVLYGEPAERSTLSCPKHTSVAPMGNGWNQTAIKAKIAAVSPAKHLKTVRLEK